MIHMQRWAKTGWTPEGILRSSAQTVHGRVGDSRLMDAAGAPQLNTGDPFTACTVAATPHTGSGIFVSSPGCAEGYKKELDSDLQGLLCIKDECNPYGAVPAMVESYYYLDSHNQKEIYPSLEGTNISGGEIFQDLMYNDKGLTNCFNYFLKSEDDLKRLHDDVLKEYPTTTVPYPAPWDPTKPLPKAPNPDDGWQLQRCTVAVPH